ncbi:MAG: type II toxin-antitoxin system HicB family antitoxin [Alphaproteobacteria bacterium]|jgi:antitoxin HicB|nr:type II toxin-antitoxin system HicB family antitoxin [Alphaproteobacteria bacterium]
MRTLKKTVKRTVKMMISPLSYTYPARLAEQDEGGYLVTFRDLPDALTDGDDRADAFEQAVDCLTAAVGARLAMSEDIPPPTPVEKGEILVPLPGVMSAKAMLRTTMSEYGISNSQLARGLGCDEKEIRRLLDPRHVSKLSRLEQALLWLGYGLSVTLTPTPRQRLLQLAAMFDDQWRKQKDATGAGGIDQAVAHAEQQVDIMREMQPFLTTDLTALGDLLNGMDRKLARVRNTLAHGKTPRQIPELPALAELINLDDFRRRA